MDFGINQIKTENHPIIITKLQEQPVGKFPS